TRQGFEIFQERWRVHALLHRLVPRRVVRQQIARHEGVQLLLQCLSLGAVFEVHTTLSEACRSLVTTRETGQGWHSWAAVSKRERTPDMRTRVCEGLGVLNDRGGQLPSAHECPL